MPCTRARKYIMNYEAYLLLTKQCIKSSNFPDLSKSSWKLAVHHRNLNITGLQQDLITQSPWFLYTSTGESHLK